MKVTITFDVVALEGVTPNYVKRSILHLMTFPGGMEYTGQGLGKNDMWALATPLHIKVTQGPDQ